MPQKRESMTNDYFLPPEWHRQEAVLLAWPHSGTDWSTYLDDITDVYITLVSLIATHERVIIAARQPDEVRRLLEKSMDGRQIANVDIYLCDCNDTWARDFGPITLLSTDRQPRLLNFNFNGWGRKFLSDKDNNITPNLFMQRAFYPEANPSISNINLVLEGGSIETDGKGTVFTTECCLLAPHRNQPMSKEMIEHELESHLGAERIVWLRHGHLIGDDTDGHVDTIVRTAPDETLLYVGCEDKNDAQYEEFKSLEEELMNLCTLEGRPYRLFSLPIPAPIYYDGERLPATYANFLVINDAVIVPTYRQRDNDDVALATISQAFPTREILPLDATTIIRQHGSVHCLTMQLPK